MCGDRLTAGEAPACVQACPHEAIRIRVVDRAQMAAQAPTEVWLPAMPHPGYAQPTTRYRTSRLTRSPDTRTGDDDRLEPEEAHWPLIVMLVMTQLSVGGFAAELVAAVGSSTLGSGSGLHPVLCVGLGWLGLAASVLHLGRPLRAYRAVIGVRHSWLSREVLAFGLFVVLATTHVTVVSAWPDWIKAGGLTRLVSLSLIVAAGLAGVACSVLVYHVVRRPYWHMRYSGVKFAGTAVVLGLALFQLALAGRTGRSVAAPAPWPLIGVALLLAAISSAKLWFEEHLRHQFARSELASLRGTAWLLAGPLARPAAGRRCLGVVGGVVLPGVTVAVIGWPGRGAAAVAAGSALLVLVLGETVERYLFFAGAVRPRMPGGLAR
jgi:DMSO reductase anchor subunit